MVSGHHVNVIESGLLEENWEQRGRDLSTEQEAIAEVWSTGLATCNGMIGPMDLQWLW